MTFQDYNQEVLRYYTLPNCMLNPKITRNKFDFIQLDWTQEDSDYTELFTFSDEYLFKSCPRSDYLERKYDVIVAADVLYETKHYQSLLDLFAKKLTKGGSVVIVTKYFYYGNRGNIDFFMSYKICNL